MSSPIEIKVTELNLSNRWMFFMQINQMPRHKKILARLLSFALVGQLLWGCNLKHAQSSNIRASTYPDPTTTVSIATTLPVVVTPPSKKTSSSPTKSRATSLPAITQTPTPKPTPTSPPVPPFVSHEWHPEDILIVFGGAGGDGGCGFEPHLPPGFVLLSDGNLFVTQWHSQLQNYQIQNTKLSRPNVCKLLNSIEQAGFFDYDPLTYIEDPKNWLRPVLGAGTTHISVQAWRSNSVSLYGLQSFLTRGDEIKNTWAHSCGNCPDLEFPTILPSIRNAFYLLENYQPDNLQIYHPGRLGVWVDDYPDETNIIDWPLKAIKLSKIVLQSGEEKSNPNLILHGSEAKTVYQLFDNQIDVCGGNFIEDGKIYRVFARPLLPDEFTSANYLPPDILSCFPADGLLETSSFFDEALSGK